LREVKVAVIDRGEAHPVAWNRRLASKEEAVFIQDRHLTVSNLSSFLASTAPSRHV
jgi:hypothetical protein